MARYIVRENSELECYEILDTESPNEKYVAEGYTLEYAKLIAKLLNQYVQAAGLYEK